MQDSVGAGSPAHDALSAVGTKISSQNIYKRFYLVYACYSFIYLFYPRGEVILWEKVMFPFPILSDLLLLIHIIQTVYQLQISHLSL